MSRCVRRPWQEEQHDKGERRPGEDLDGERRAAQDPRGHRAEAVADPILQIVDRPVDLLRRDRQRRAADPFHDPVDGVPEPEVELAELGDPGGIRSPKVTTSAARVTNTTTSAAKPRANPRRASQVVGGARNVAKTSARRTGRTTRPSSARRCSPDQREGDDDEPQRVSPPAADELVGMP